MNKPIDIEGSQIMPSEGLSTLRKRQEWRDGKIALAVIISFATSALLVAVSSA